MPRFESAELVLVHCNLVNNSYQKASKVLFTFVPNKHYPLYKNGMPKNCTPDRYCIY